MNTRRIGAGGVLTLAILLGAASRALAQPSETVTRAAARAAAEEGLALYDSGQYPAALDKFNRADDLVHAPTMSLMAARCLEKLGRLVEASERYRVASRAQLDAGASDGFKAAVVKAEKQYKALQPRIPRITLGVSGASPGDVEITIDGKAVPVAMVGIERPTDPGHHTVKGRRGAEVVVREIELKEGDAIEVALRLAGGDAAPAAAGAVGATQRAIGWTGVGLGVAGLVFGGVTLGLKISAQNGLTSSSGCTPDFVCPPSAKAAVDHYYTLRPMPVAGFAAGGAALAAGAVLLLTAPRARPTGGALTLLPWMGPHGGGLTGVF